MTPSASIAGRGRRTTRWTREEIITKIHQWYDRHGEAPGSADWNPSLARWRAQEWRIERYRAGVWPSTNAVKRAFGGSFDAAVRAAGYVPHRSGPRPAGSARPDVEPRAPLPPRDLHAQLHAERERAEAAEARAAALADQLDAERRGAPRVAAMGTNGTRRVVVALDGSGPAGAAVLTAALRDVAHARSHGQRAALARALGEVAAAALAWRERL